MHIQGDGEIDLSTLSSPSVFQPTVVLYIRIRVTMIIRIIISAKRARNTTRIIVRGRLIRFHETHADPS